MGARQIQITAQEEYWEVCLAPQDSDHLQVPEYLQGRWWGHSDGLGLVFPQFTDLGCGLVTQEKQHQNPETFELLSKNNS